MPVCAPSRCTSALRVSGLIWLLCFGGAVAAEAPRRVETAAVKASCSETIETPWYQPPPQESVDAQRNIAPTAGRTAGRRAPRKNGTTR